MRDTEVLYPGEVVPPGLVARAWGRLDAPVAGRTVPGTFIAAGFAAVVGLVMSYVSYQQGWTLLFFDARSHLTIGRAVIDSQNPGFYQLGTVWLPAPHVLLIPFMSVFTLWQTGLGGSILGVLCLAVSAAALWRITARVGFNRPAKIITVVVFVSNPTLLYLTTTALTEPVLIAAWLAALAGLAGWITAMPSISAGALAVFAGVPSAVAVLSRYEGWVFVAIATAFIILASWRRWRSVSYTVTLVASYLAVPVAAVVWWFAYNFVRFGDPLEFARGPYSAGAEAILRAGLGVLPQKGNLGLSLQIYHTSALNIIGWPLLILALAGAAFLIWQRGASTTALLLWIPIFTYPFIVLSLYLGQIIIVNEGALPTATLYNNRYTAGNFAIVALLCGALVDAAVNRIPRFGRALAAAIAGVAIAFALWSLSDGYNRMIILREGYSNTVQPNALAAGQYIKDHYEGGFVLIEAGSRGDAMLVGLNNDQVITVDNGPIFENATRDPSGTVAWALINTSLVRDSIWTTLKDDPAFTSRFALVFDGTPFRVYQNLQMPGSGQ